MRLFKVPWPFISTVIFYTLLYYNKQKSYFSFVNDGGIEQINIKKET